MKSQTVAITIAVLALPIYAQQDQPRPNTTTTTLSVPISQQPTDSPLVRAAKATGRLGKRPGFIITNDTLLRVGAGHMAVSTSQGAALPTAPLPKDPIATPQRPLSNAKTKADAAAARQRLGQANADYSGENVEARHDDPVQQEHQLQQAVTPKPPEN